MIRGVLAAAAVVLGCAPASAAVIAQVSGYDAEGWGINYMFFDYNMKPPPPTLVPGKTFQVMVEVNGPTENLVVEAIGGYRVDDFVDGVPSGGGESEFYFATEPIAPGRWRAELTAIDELRVQGPRLTERWRVALIGASIAAVDEARLAPFAYRITITDVPEPASWAMMITGIGLAGAAARRVNGLQGRRIAHA